MKEIRSYSEAFKLQVVHELESGKFGSCFEASSTYGIKGASTVYNWVRKYGKNHLIGKVVRVETLNERQEIKRLKEEVRELKLALADANLDLRIERGYLKLACRDIGTDVEKYKKKVSTV
jgi:transposase-like protein